MQNGYREMAVCAEMGPAIPEAAMASKAKAKMRIICGLIVLRHSVARTHRTSSSI
jgi:hypothetical protein